MKKISNLFTIILAVAICVGLVASGASAMNVGEGVTVNIENFYEAQSEGPLGGEIHNVLESFDAGIAVNGTTVIDSSGNWDGAVTGTTGTFSSTLTVTGAATFNGTATFTGNVTGISSSTLATLDVTGDTKLDKLVQGGSVYAATTTPSAALVLLAADICDNSYIGLTPSAAIDVTLPATTTLFADCLTVNGDFVDVIIGNNSATAATTTTIVAGAGIDLQEPDGQNVVIGGLNYGILKIMRISATEAVAVVNETIPAD